MWQPKSFYLKNWQSFQEQAFEFKPGVPLLLIGQNFSDPGSESNGSGKSALQEAIYYNLTGSTIRKIRDLKLVTLGEESNCNEFEYKNSITNEVLRIRREVYLKGSSKLSIYLNGIDQKNKFSSVNEGNKLILDHIGITLEDLQNYFIVSKEKYTSFFTSSDTKKKELIGRFSNADKISGIDALIQADIDIKEAEKNKFVTKKIQLETKIQVYKEEIEKLSETKLIEQRNKEIEEIESTIDSLSNEILQYENKITDTNLQFSIASTSKKNEQVRLLENEKILDSLKEVKFDEEIKTLNQQKELKNKDIVSIRENKKNLEDTLDEFNTFLREVQNNIEGSVKCPKCAHEFLIGDEEVDIQEAKSMLPEIIENIEQTKSRVTETTNNINKIRSEIEVIENNVVGYRKQIDMFMMKKQGIQKTINEIKTLISNYDIKINTLNSSIEFYQNKIKITKDTIELKNKAIVDLQNKEIVNKTEEYIKLIDDVNLQLGEIEKVIEEKDDEIYQLNQWISLFGRFYSHLANKSLSVIEGYCNMYLKRMDTNLQLKFEGFKTLANNKIKENITPQVLRDGIIEGEFGQMSGGERGKLDLSAMITNQSLINMNSPSGGLDLLWIDECLDSIDATGISGLIDSIKDLNRTVVLTTHIAHDKNNSNNTLIVRKENKVSKILN